MDICPKCQGKGFINTICPTCGKKDYIIKTNKKENKKDTITYNIPTWYKTNMWRNDNTSLGKELETILRDIVKTGTNDKSYLIDSNRVDYCTHFVFSTFIVLSQKYKSISDVITAIDLFRIRDYNDRYGKIKLTNNINKDLMLIVLKEEDDYLGLESLLRCTKDIVQKRSLNNRSTFIITDIKLDTFEQYIFNLDNSIDNFKMNNPIYIKEN